MPTWTSNKHTQTNPFGWVCEFSKVCLYLNSILEYDAVANTTLHFLVSNVKKSKRIHEKEFSVLFQIVSKVAQYVDPSIRNYIKSCIRFERKQ